MDNGNKLITDKETISILTKHFYKVCNRDTIVDLEFINKILVHPTVCNMARPIILDELNITTNKLA